MGRSALPGAQRGDLRSVRREAWPGVRLLDTVTYQLHPAESGDPVELMLSTATFDWPLPAGEDEITLVPPEPGWTQQELFK